MCIVQVFKILRNPIQPKMQQRKCFLKIFLLLAFFTISYSLTSLCILYSDHRDAMPDFFNSAKELFAPDYLSCYYTEEKGNLRVIDDNPKPEDALFFHETNCQSSLSLREACSVESAARTHPNRQVYVVFSKAQVELSPNGFLTVLSKIPNVHFYRVDLNTYAKNTPLQHVFSPRGTWLGKWHYRKIGELFKFLTLYKFGGTVVDLDMMVVRPLGTLGHNWASKLGDNLESGIISVFRGLSGKFYSKEFLSALKRQIVYDGGTNAECALKDALTTLCNTTDLQKMTSNKCQGFHIYEDEFFSPGERWSHNVTAANVSNHYLGYHLWDERDDDEKFMSNDSLYVNMAQRYCPLVFNNFMSPNVDKLLIKPLLGLRSSLVKID